MRWFLKLWFHSGSVAVCVAGLFDRYDTDHSLSLSYTEFSKRLFSGEAAASKTSIL